MTPRSRMTCPLDLASGGALDLANPDPEAIRLDDVAVGLARTVRYRGQTGPFYSVAEHAVLVADKLHDLGASPAEVLAGLHHDDAEAYTGDLHGPLKHGRLFAPVMDVWIELEVGLDRAIVRGLGLPLEAQDLHDPLVKDVDYWALRFEKARLYPDRDWGEKREPAWSLDWPGGTWYGGLNERLAAVLWRQAHERYTRAWRMDLGLAA